MPNEIDEAKVSNKDKLIEQYKYNLQLRNILVERVLLGLIIGILGFIASLLVHDYRENLARDTIFWQSKLSSAVDIRDAYSSITRYYYNYSRSFCTQYGQGEQSKNSDSSHDTHSTKAQSLLSEYNYIVNSSAIYFSDEFLNYAEIAHQVFYSVFAKGTWDIDILYEKLCTYRPFVSDIADGFTSLIRAEIGTVPINKQSFFLDNDDGISGIEGRLHEYFEENFNKWEHWNNAKD